MGDYSGPIALISAGQPVKFVDLDTWHDALDSLAAAWTPFVPTLGATGGGALVGNGTLTGKYRRTGKQVRYQGKLTWGTTTSFGSGVVTLSLPTNCVDALGIGNVLAIPASLAAARVCQAQFRSTSLLQFWCDPNDTGGLGGQFTAGVPFTWASGNQLYFDIEYEAA